MLEIRLKTLTPLWTGGVDQRPDRLHETGLIGSLRWWYEALVRGLGGHACDPTGDGTKCKEYDPEVGSRSVCAACYLFGATGWARLCRVRVIEDSIRQEPLHFYTTLPMNRGWLQRLFKMDKTTTVPFGAFRLILTGRGVCEDYALRQFCWALAVAAKHGGLGAKLQHGFGQVALLTDLSDRSASGENELKQRLERGDFRPTGKREDWPDSSRLFWQTYHLPTEDRVLGKICDGRNRVGRTEGSGRPAYLPCVFDLRYKGEIEDKQLGFRQWLINREWSREQIADLMGETQARRDEERRASRLCMSMPWLDGERGYVIKVFGFAPPNLEIDRITTELDAYMDHLFSYKPVGGGQGWTTEPI